MQEIESHVNRLEHRRRVPVRRQFQCDAVGYRREHWTAFDFQTVGGAFSRCRFTPITGKGGPVEPAFSALLSRPERNNPHRR